MAERGPDDCLEEILALPGEIRWSIERACAIKGVTAYVVHSFDRTALLFSVPVLIHRSLPEEIPLDIRGAAGAVTMIIEQVKQKEIERAAAKAALEAQSADKEKKKRPSRKRRSRSKRRTET
ncbi:MAG TPA: hypothetical protein PK477_05535 [Methanoregulaceae archaeon]|nr:hypothetical protein [Methanoregulaceae archaeon]